MARECLKLPCPSLKVLWNSLEIHLLRGLFKRIYKRIWKILEEYVQSLIWNIPSKNWKYLIWNCFILFFDLSSNLHRYDLSTLALYYFNADYLFSLSGQRQRQDKANKQMDTALSTVITACKIYLLNPL